MTNRYLENCKNLKDRIREYNLNVEDSISDNEACYFCLAPIEGPVKSVTVTEHIKGIESIVRYALHPRCYSKALDVKQDFYIIGVN